MLSDIVFKSGFWWVSIRVQRWIRTEKWKDNTKSKLLLQSIRATGNCLKFHVSKLPHSQHSPSVVYYNIMLTNLRNFQHTDFTATKVYHPDAFLCFSSLNIFLETFQRFPRKPNEASSFKLFIYLFIYSHYSI